MRTRFGGFDSAEEVEDAFYEALRTGDLSALMDIWADDDDVLCIHPGGQRIEGLDAVRDSWTEILRNGAMAIRPVQRQCFTGVALSVHIVVEAIEISGERGKETLYCHATNVYGKDATGWRLLAHHASPPSEQDDAPAEPPPGGMLH